MILSFFFDKFFIYIVCPKYVIHWYLDNDTWRHQTKVIIYMSIDLFAITHWMKLDRVDSNRQKVSLDFFNILKDCLKNYIPVSTVSRSQVWKEYWAWDRSHLPGISLDQVSSPRSTALPPPLTTFLKTQQQFFVSLEKNS